MNRKLFIFLIIFLFCVLLVFINLVAHQYDLRLDLTAAGQHTLSKDTDAYIKGLDQQIRITALHVGIPPKYLEDMFEEYERRSRGRITTKIVDPLVDIGYASQFGNIITGKQKKVVVQSETNRQDVDFTDSVLTEELLTNAIIRSARPVRKVCFVTGHNEYQIGEEDDHGLSTFDQLLGVNNMESLEIFLGSEGTIPSYCDVLVIAGPQLQPSKEEEALIQDYLKKGGDALFLIENTKVTTPDKPLTAEELELNPSLNSILNEWGLKVANDVVIDADSHASGDVGSPATKNYLAHRAIVAELDYTFYVRPRSISMLPGRRETLKVAPVVLTQSAERSWGETDRMLRIKFDEGVDRAGPVPIAFVVWEPKAQGEASDTRIMVFTDADFLTNIYIGAVNNAQMGLNAVNWLSELDYKTFLDKKKFEVKRLDLNSAQKRIVLIILVAMPLLIAFAGLVVWLRKR